MPQSIALHDPPRLPDPRLPFLTVLSKPFPPHPAPFTSCLPLRGSPCFCLLPPARTNASLPRAPRRIFHIFFALGPQRLALAAPDASTTARAQTRSDDPYYGGAAFLSGAFPLGGLRVRRSVCSCSPQARQGVSAPEPRTDRPRSPPPPTSRPFFIPPMAAADSSRIKRAAARGGSCRRTAARPPYPHPPTHPRRPSHGTKGGGIRRHGGRAEGRRRKRDPDRCNAPAQRPACTRPGCARSTPASPLRLVR